MYSWSNTELFCGSGLRSSRIFELLELMSLSSHFMSPHFVTHTLSQSYMRIATLQLSRQDFKKASNTAFCNTNAKVKLPDCLHTSKWATSQFRANPSRRQNSHLVLALDMRNATASPTAKHSAAIPPKTAAYARAPRKAPCSGPTGLRPKGMQSILSA